MTKNPHLSDPKVFANWKVASVRNPTQGLNRAVNCVNVLAAPKTWNARAKFRKKKGPVSWEVTGPSLDGVYETCLSGHTSLTNDKSVVEVFLFGIRHRNLLRASIVK